MSSSDFEKSENEKYRQFIEKELVRSKQEFCPIRREKQLDHLLPKIREEIQRGSRDVLDLCCGQGRLIHFLREDFPQLKVHGIDYLEALIKDARQTFSQDSLITLEVGNAMDLPAILTKKFDMTIIHKTVSCLPYYENIIRESIRVTKNRIFITSLFWDGDIDFITKVYKDASKNQENFFYLNNYSLPKFVDYCLALGVKNVKATPMKIDIDLDKGDIKGPLRSYTEVLATGERLEMTGAIGLNWKLIELEL